MYANYARKSRRVVISVFVSLNINMLTSRPDTIHFIKQSKKREKKSTSSHSFSQPYPPDSSSTEEEDHTLCSLNKQFSQFKPIVQTYCCFYVDLLFL